MTSPKAAPPSLSRRIPSVDEILRTDGVAALLDSHPRSLVADAVRAALADLRKKLLSGAKPADANPEALTAAVRNRLESERRKGLRNVVNATGILLHTGLGRAVLADAARKALADLGGYASLELDVDTNERGQRDAYASRLLCRLTGAPDACVVNNNAAATMIALSSLASGREVIVARGQLVEIGGSFRLPEVMEKSGAILREVGTTNRARAADYARAIRRETGLLLRVHTSNYKVVGFTEEVPIEELAKLGRRKRIPVMDDIGSGALIDFARWGLPEEPMASRSLKAGADVVCFSGDKLLGGPQAGILLGKRGAIAAIRKNPLYRAFRVGKTTLAPLQATLEIYLDGEERALREIPTLRMIRLQESELKPRAERLARLLAAKAPALQAEAVRTASQLGSGSMPTHDLASWAVSLRSKTLSAAGLARNLRVGEPAILTRVQKGSVLLDLRTVDPAEEAAIEQAIAEL